MGGAQPASAARMTLGARYQAGRLDDLTVDCL